MTPNEFAEYLLSKNNGDALQALQEPCENIAWLTDIVSHRDISAAIRDLQPIRRGDEIFITLNGEELKLSPMQAQLIMRAWVEGVGGAFVVCAHSSGAVPDSPM